MYSKELQQDLKILASYVERIDMAGSTIMVTGVTGLIGSLITKGIIEYNKTHNEKINIVGIARSPIKVNDVFSNEYNEREEICHVRFVYQDICDKIPDDITCDYIIHTASATASKFFTTNPVEVIDSIYTGTRQVLEYGKSNNVKGIVYLSSMEVFGQVNSMHRIHESELGYLDIQNTRSCYSEGKRLAECMCKCYAQEYNIPVKVARLAQVFGPGISKEENRVFAQFAKNAIRGEDIILHTEGRSMGNYCYTVDAIKALFLLLKKGENGNVYTVVNEDTTRTIADMAQLVAENLSEGRSKVIFDIPKENQYGYAPETKMKLSSKKLRELGWKPETGLLEMYERMVLDLKG